MHVYVCLCLCGVFIYLNACLYERMCACMLVSIILCVHVCAFMGVCILLPVFVCVLADVVCCTCMRVEVLGTWAPRGGSCPCVWSRSSSSSTSACGRE